MMIKEAGSVNGSKIVLGVLVTLLVLLNFGGFLIYFNSHPHGNIWIRLWDYLSSHLFELITISLIFPIFLLVLENHFKFVQSLLAGRLQQALAIEEEQRERVRKLREDRTKQRLEAVRRAQCLLYNLSKIASQVIFYQVNGVDEKDLSKAKSSLNDKEPKLVKIRQEIALMGMSGNELMNTWGFQLRVSDEDAELIVKFLNTLLFCAETAARCIHEKSKPEEIEELQKALSIIKNRVEWTIYHPTISLAKLCMQALEMQDDDAPAESTKKIEAEIVQIREFLKMQNEWLVNLERSYDDRFYYLEQYVEADAYRRALLRTHIDECLHGVDELQELWEMIPLQIRLEAGAASSYSPEFIKRFASMITYEANLACKTGEKRLTESELRSFNQSSTTNLTEL